MKNKVVLQRRGWWRANKKKKGKSAS